MVVRGRALSPVRPGIIIKRVLMGEFPLSDGTRATEAAITDIHSAYRDFVNQVNQTRPRDRRLKPMNHASFYTLFKFVRLLGLVGLVREEPMLYPPPTGSLFIIRARKAPPRTRAYAIKAVRRVFKLTDIGAQDERSWLDLRRAWMEKWPIPQTVEHFPTPEELIAESVERAREREALEAEAVRVRPVKVRKVKPEVAERKVRKEEEVVEKAPVIEPTAPIPKYKRAVKPSKRQYTLLLEHLTRLQQLSPTRADVIKHIALDIEAAVADWQMEVEDSLDSAVSAGKVARINELTVEKDLLSQLYESILDRDLTVAITVLGELIASS